ncbi:MAG: hypothetical protein OXG42_03715 [Chloroflexi bacterium]|nr:hypothetical protein [Chloroflexota bacterium]
MFHYERESRTAQSECYIVENETGSRGRVDLHFAAPLVYATLCVPESWAEEDIQDVIADVDDRWAQTADPLRDDLIVTVWRGQEVGVYSQEDGAADD